MRDNITFRLYLEDQSCGAQFVIDRWLGPSPTTAGVRGSLSSNGYDRTGEGRAYEREFIWDRSPDRGGSRLFGLALLGRARGVVCKSLSTGVGRRWQSAAAHVP